MPNLRYTPEESQVNPQTGTAEYFNLNKNTKDPVFDWSEIRRQQRNNESLVEPVGLAFEPYGGMKSIDERLGAADLDDIPEARANAQTKWELAGKALGQTATETALGTLEGLGYLVDAPSTISNIVRGREKDFDNWWSKSMREAKEGVNDALFPIYQTRGAQSGKDWDKTWWASNTSSIATSVSLMLPSTAVAWGIGSALSKMTKLSKNAIKLSQTVGSGLASRAMESQMEAQQYKEQYRDETKEKLAPEYIKNAQVEIDKLPMGMPFNPESNANYTPEDREKDVQKIQEKYKAALDEEVETHLVNGANKDFYTNAGLAVLDMFQYSKLLHVFSGEAKSIGGKIVNTIFQPVSEGMEEAYQTGAQMEAFDSETKGHSFLGPGFSERVIEYLKDGNLQTSAFWGAIGGGVFDALGPVARKAAETGETIGNAWQLARFKKDLVAENKINDEIINSTVMNQARRGTLDKMTTTMSNFSQSVDDEQLAKNNTTREELNKKIDKINDTVGFVAETKAKLDANNSFEGKENAKNLFIEQSLTSRSNDRIIKEGNEHIDKSIADLVQSGELTPELAQIKRLKLDIDGLTTLRGNLSKMPSLKGNKEAQANLAKKIDVSIATLQAGYDTTLESYKNNNKQANILTDLVTTKDDELNQTQGRVSELQFVQTNVVKPTLQVLNTLDGIDKAEKAEAEKVKKAHDTALANQVKNAKDTKDIQTAKDTEKINNPQVDEETGEVLESTEEGDIDKVSKDLASKEEETASDKPSERYIDKPNLQAKELVDLDKSISYTPDDQEVREAWEDLLFSTSQEQFNESTNTIVKLANMGIPSAIRLLGDIANFYKGKNDQKLNTVEDKYVIPDNQIPIAGNTHNTSDIDFISKTAVKENNPNASSDLRSTATQVYMVNKNGKWFLATNEDGSLKEGVGVSMGIDYDYLNNPANVVSGSEIYFVVDMDKVKFNKDPYHASFKTIEEQRNKFAILIAQKDSNGKEHIIGSVPALYNNDNSNKSKVLSKLRDNIHKQIANSNKKGLLNTGITSKVTTAYPGRIATTNKKSTNESAKYVNPHEALDSDRELILGIAITKNGITTIDTGNLDPSKSKYNGIKVDPIHDGGVFMLIEGANGEIIPVKTFTTHLKNKSEYFAKVKELIAKHLVQNTANVTNEEKAKWVEARKELRQYVYSDYMFIPTENKFKITAGKDIGRKFTADEFLNYLSTKPNQVDINNINVGNYNQNLSKSGLLKTDLLRGKNIVNANFDFSSSDIKENGVESKDNSKIEVDKVESPEIVEESTNISIALNDQKTTKLNTENTEKSTKPVAPIQRIGKKSTIGPKIDLSRLDRSAVDKEYQVWNKNAEIAWFRKNFGDEAANALEIRIGLLNIANSGGKQTWGQFREGVIILSNIAAKGTLYHEAFHRVSQLFLTDKQRTQIYNEAAAKYNIDPKDILKIEERLAEEFREYTQTKEESKPSWSKSISDFFKKLYYIVKSNITNNISINQLFNHISTGEYKNPKYSRNVNNTKGVELNRVFNNIYDESRRVTNLADAMRQQFDSIISDHQEYSTMPRKDLLTALVDNTEAGVELKGVEILAIDAYNYIHEQYLENQTASPAIIEKVNTMLSNFITMTPEGIIWGELGRKAVLEFSISEGIRISLKDKSVSNFVDSAQEVGTVLDEINEDDTKLEGWQVKTESMSGKESLSKEVRKELSYIPLLDSKESDGIAKDDLGFAKYYDFNTIYATLKRDLSDILDSDEMLEKLASITLEKPYLTKLYDKMLNDDLFKSKMFVDFAKSQREYKTIIEDRVYNKEDGSFKTTYKLVTSNRNNTKNMVIDDFKNSATDSNINTLLNKDGSINKDKAADFVKFVSAMITYNKKNDATDRVFENISNRLRSIGLEVSKEEVSSIYVDSIQKGGKISAKQNLNNLLSNLETLANAFNKGVNPLNAETMESTAVDNVASIISKVKFELLESSFRNGNGDNIYTHQVPTFLSKLIAKFSGKNGLDLIEWYQNSKFYRDSPWLSMLSENSKLRKDFDFVEIDSAKAWGKDTGVRYTEMSDKDYELASVNMFFNNASKSTAFFRMPVFADAPKMLFIRFNKLAIDSTRDTKGVLDYLVDVFHQEKARIDDVLSRHEQQVALLKDGKVLPDSLKPIKNYDTGKSTRFLLLTALNHDTVTIGNRTINVKEAVKNNDTQTIKEILKGWIDSEATKDFERLTKLGVFGELANVDERIKNNYGGSEAAFHREYFYNTVLANTQTTTLFSGDPAFYKEDGKSPVLYSRTIDYQKRNKQNVSPALMLDTDAVYHLTEEQAKIEGSDSIKVRKTYKSIYLEDLEIPSSNAEHIYNTLIESGMSEDEAGDIAAAYGYSSDGRKTSNINVADAQAYITLPRYREIMMGLGRWTYRHQEIYPKLLNGTANKTDLKFVMSPLKPFYFGHIQHESGLIIPVQNKNSEYLLLPQLVNGSPELSKLYDYMIKNVISSVNFESAVKAGNYGAVSATLDNLGAATIHNLNNSDYGLQQETPEHYLDAKSLFGSQIRKLILADIADDAVFNIDGKDFDKKTLIDLYQQIIVEDLKEAYNQTADKFVEIEDVQQLLLDEIRDRKLGSEMERAVQIVTRNINGQDVKTFNLPLAHPAQAKRVESLLNSIFKNNVTKQKIKGGSFVQLSAFGFSKDLHLNIVDGRLESVECKLPWWSKKYFEPLLDENGQLDINNIKDKSLLEMIGYRIPTEDKYSMLPLKVVGFLPAGAGGAIMLPMEITTISGSDFDIDKLYIMMPEFEKAYDKTIIKQINSTIKQKMISAVKAGKLSQVVPKESFDIARILQFVEDGIDLDRDDNLVYKLYLQGVEKGFFKEPSLSGIRKVKFDYDSVVNNEDNNTVSGNNIANQSKAARNNAKIDIIRSILTHSDTFPKFIKPGGYDTLKSTASNILKLEGRENERLDMIFPSTQTELFKRNMAGRALKGIFASHNANHAVLQHTNIEFNKPITIDDIEYQSLHNVKNIEGKFISRNVAEFLAAAVDNAKDPVLGFMNINTYTANTAAVLARMGVPINTIGLLLSHPSIKRLTTLYFNNGADFQAESKALSDMGMENLQGMLHDINSEKLERDIKNKVDNNAYIVETFLALKAWGNSLADLNRATKADTVGAGPVLASNEVQQRTIEKVLASETLLGTGDLLHGRVYPSIKAFQEYGIDKPTELLSKYFPWNSKAFKAVKKYIIDNIKSNNLNEKQLEQINYELLTYLSTGYDFFNDSPEARKANIEGLPNKFTELKQKYPEIFKSNQFLNRLSVESNEEINLKRINFKNVGSINNEERELITDGWMQLLENSEEMGNFANDLVKYTFYTAGFKFTPTSFGHLTPVEFYEKLGVTNNKTGFNIYLMKEFADAAENEEMYNSFIDQFFKNNYENSTFVPRVDRELANITGAVQMQNKVPYSFTVDSSDSNTRLDFVLKSDKESTKFVPYVSYNYKGNIYLFKQLNTMDKRIATYVLTNKLGITNYALEYNKDGNIVSNSVFDRNNITKLVSAKIEEVVNNSDVNYENTKENMMDDQNVEQVAENKESSFQGYKGGFDSEGKGTPTGDGKDKAMRQVANGFIGETSNYDKPSSTMTSANEINNKVNKHLGLDKNQDIKFANLNEDVNSKNFKESVPLSGTVLLESSKDNIIMLARNGSLKGKPLSSITKEQILNQSNKNSTFVVGDMPNVDSQFIDYLQEIGAKFTVYHTGNSSRINVNDNVSNNLDSQKETQNLIDTRNQLKYELSSNLELLKSSGIDYKSIDTMNQSELNELLKEICK